MNTTTEWKDRMNDVESRLQRIAQMSAEIDTLQQRLDELLEARKTELREARRQLSMKQKTQKRKRQSKKAE